MICSGKASHADSMQDVVFAAFLIVDDELHGDARAAGPFCLRWPASVSHHVAAVAPA